MTDDNVSLLESEEKLPFCLTPSAIDVHSLLATCASHALLGVIVGAPGTGKTTALRHYPRQVKLFTATRAESPMAVFLKALHADLGSYTRGNTSSSEVLRSCVDTLAGRYASGRRMLIVDEAHYLGDDALDAIADMYDLLKDRGVGLVLCGNVTLPARWSQTTDDAIALRQFQKLAARIGPTLILKEPTSADVQMIAEVAGITGRDGRALVLKAAKKFGQLHAVANLLSVARQSDGSFPVERLRDAALALGQSS